MSPSEDPTSALWRELERSVRSSFASKVRAEDVDDLVQEAFLRIHQSLPDVRDPERIGAWVGRVSARLLIDYWRGRGRDPETALPEEPELEREDPGLDSLVARWLPSFIDSLPEAYREPVRLAELEGLSGAEVARRLGLTLPAAKARVLRGRRALRAALQACCRLEFDTRGGILETRPNGPSCTC